ncbi:MAG: ROK family protein, partial [Patescibacteria group bacterium]
MLTLGVDIGGTKVLAGLVDRRLRIVREIRTPLDSRMRATVLRSIEAGIAPLMTRQVRAIGIGTTGLVNTRRGIVSATSNMPRSWRRVPLRSILSRRFRVPVFVDNDAHCFALAEAVVGLGRRYHTVLGLTIGTGVGVGLVVDGRLYRGGWNATEFGHTTVSAGSERCGCGMRGHLESIVSGPAMAHAYRRLANRRCTPREVEALANRGDRR